MKIYKVISNNVVMTILDDGTEALIMGKGIGYGQANATLIDPSLVEKTFRLDTLELKEKMAFMLERDSGAYFELTREIVAFAEKRLDCQLDEQIYLALTDHISFAIKRYDKNIAFENPLSWEIKTLYPAEHELGMWMLDFIEDKLAVRLCSSEASFIALHLVNASLGLQINNTMKITALTHDVLALIANYFTVQFDESSLNFIRLVTHLKFFSHRIFSQMAIDESEDDLSRYILSIYPKESACVEAIGKEIAQKYDYHIELKEAAYLTLHIHRVLN
ncbi:MAG: PRD domain-containing protein [Culicoidibacterales bacterium]